MQNIGGINLVKSKNPIEGTSRKEKGFQVKINNYQCMKRSRNNHKVNINFNPEFNNIANVR